MLAAFAANQAEVTVITFADAIKTIVATDFRAYIGMGTARTWRRIVTYITEPSSI